MSAEQGNHGTREQGAALTARPVLNQRVASHRTPIRRFEDLEVWQLAREIVRGVYRAARSQPLRGDPTLSSQMKRAAVSICSNIAEGFERGTRKQYIEFVYIAKGSAGELRCQAILAWDSELLDQCAFDWLHDRCERCSRMLAAYLKHLQSTRTTVPGLKHREELNSEA